VDVAWYEPGIQLGRRSQPDLKISPSFSSPGEGLVAWAGWWLPVDPSWRLLRVEGTYSRGLLILGNESRPLVELSWAWVTRKSLNVERFAKRFLLRGLRSGERAAAAKNLRVLPLAGFDFSVVRDIGDSHHGVAFCNRTNRFLQWIYRPDHNHQVNKFEKEILSQWKDQPLMEPTRWKFFDVEFSAPPGFRIVSSNLMLGRMEVVLVDPTPWDGRHRIRLCWIYPASLALSRQSGEDWLKMFVKEQRGVYRSKRRAVIQTRSGLENVNAWELELILSWFLRFPLRPFSFRMPAAAKASLHHLQEKNQLLYLQCSAKRDRLEDLEEAVVRSCS
jgi:hypothetical protein